MYLAYIDESGDSGTHNSPSNHFVLSAIVFHESYWLDFLNDLIVFRKGLKAKYGLLLKEEIHAAEFINGRPKLRNGADRFQRFMILRECLDFLNSKTNISIVTLRYHKSVLRVNTDVFTEAWTYFIQRIENTLGYKNFPGAFPNEKGILIPDNSDIARLNKIARKMRRYNPVNNIAAIGQGTRMLPMKHVIKDPIFRDSKHSYFHQMVDVVVYFARQAYEPNNYIKKKGGKGFYKTRLSNVTNKHVTRSTTTINNIVEI